MSKQTSGLKLYIGYYHFFLLTKADFFVFVCVKNWKLKTRVCRPCATQINNSQKQICDDRILRFDIIYWDRLQSFSTQYIQSISFPTSPKRSSQGRNDTPNFLCGFQVARGQPEADRHSQVTPQGP